MLDFFNDILWGKVLIALLIAVGLGFTLASRFVQFRYFGRMFRILSASQAFKKDKHGHGPSLTTAAAPRRSSTSRRSPSS